MSLINIQADNVKSFISGDEITVLEQEIKKCHLCLKKGTGEGADFLGWMHLPSQTPEKLLNQIEERAHAIRKRADILICIGIGGSYLGTKAGIDFLKAQDLEGLEVKFIGHHIASESVCALLRNIGDRRICLNVISKYSRKVRSIFTICAKIAGKEESFSRFVRKS